MRFFSTYRSFVLVQAMSLPHVYLGLSKVTSYVAKTSVAFV
jgi:hypothetical protein